MEKAFFLFGDIVAAVAFFFVVRVVLNGFGLIQQDILKVGLLIILVLGYVFFVSKKKGMTLKDIRLQLPQKNHWLLILGVLLPATYYIPQLLFPGEWISQPWNTEIWKSVFLPSFLHYGLGSGISEELLFRGYLLKHTENQYGRMKAVLITSLAFGLMHLLNGFSSPLDALWTIFSTGILGAILSMLTYITGSLVYPMIIHGMNNLSSFLISAGTGDSPARFYYLMDTFSYPVLYSSIGAGLVLILAFLIWYSKKHPTEE